MVFLNSTDNAYTVCRFLSNFYDTSPRKLPHTKNELPRPKKASKPLRSFFGASVTAIHFANIINLSVKLDTFFQNGRKQK